MRPTAKITHQTRGRIRLRIVEKRRDLPYFLDLYEHLRDAPGVEEITMNPVTGSVLLHYSSQQRNTVLGVLSDSPMLSFGPGLGGLNGNSEAADTRGRIERFLAAENSRPTDPRTLVFLIMVALSIRQLYKGQVLAPLLTLAAYGIDFAAGQAKNRQALDTPALPTK